MYMYVYNLYTYVVALQVHKLIQEFQRQDLTIWGGRGSDTTKALYKMVCILYVIQRLSNVNDTSYKRHKIKIVISFTLCLQRDEQ